jgi:hypothetical protein
MLAFSNDISYFIFSGISDTFFRRSTFNDLWGTLLTAAAKQVLHALPRRTLKKLEALSLKTGTDPAEIIAAGIDLYEKHFSSKNLRVIPTAGDKLSRLVKDPEKREIFQDVMSAMAKQTANSMTKAQRVSRAKKAAEARWRKKEE